MLQLISDGGDLLLASAAQDTLIRVWRIALETVKDQINPDLQSNRGNFSVFHPDELKFKCELETVLQGHENWVYGLHWQSPVLISKFKTRSVVFNNLIILFFSQMMFERILCGYFPARWIKP